MKIGESIKRNGSSLSFELFPPKDDVGRARLVQTVKRLESFNPHFVSTTYGAAGNTRENTKYLIETIQRNSSITILPHLTCVGHSREEIKNILDKYKEMGIDNILALRGDLPVENQNSITQKTGFCHAIDIVSLASSDADFSTGVAVYPEGHAESPNLEMDMYYTRQKIDAGADFAITQMFFDNSYFYRFLESAKKAGITVPIIAGIMPITDLEKVKRFCKICSAKLPDSILQKLENRSAAEVKKSGVEITVRQCADLLEHGVRYFHFYTLNKADVVSRIVTELDLDKLGYKDDT